MSSIKSHSRIPALLIITFALIGTCNAAYVSYLFYFVLSGDHGFLFCDINSIFACSQALLLKNAQFFGVPACTAALIVYPIIAILGYRAYRRPSADTFLPVVILSALGIGMNGYVIYQEFLANVYCILCLACGAIILSIFLSSLYGYAKVGYSVAAIGTVILVIIAIALYRIDDVPQSYDKRIDGKITIVTTIAPLYSFTVNVAGNIADVVNLVPAGMSVHEWSPLPSDMRTLEHANVLIINGLGLEPFLPKIRETYPNLSIIDTSSGIIAMPLVSFEAQGSGSVASGTMDPHIFLDPIRVIQQVTAIAQWLGTIDPNHKVSYTSNAQAYTEKLLRLDALAKITFHTTPHAPFIVFHDAFGYFLSRYDLSGYQRGAIEAFAGREPTAAYLQWLGGTIRSQGVGIIFTEPVFSPRVAESLATEYHIRSYPLNPENMPLTATGYESGFTDIVSTFSTAFMTAYGSGTGTMGTVH